MPYDRKNLNTDEEVVLDLHPHLIYFLEPALALAGLFILLVVVAITMGGGTSRDVLSYAIIGFFLISLVWLAIRYVKWITTMFVLTTDRVIYREGVLAKHGVEIPLERVNNVNFHQGIFERMVGAGDLLIESGGVEGRSRFHDVRHPDSIQNTIHGEIDANYDRERGRPFRNDTAGIAGPPPAASSPLPPPGGGMAASVDVASQLEKLEGLLRRGTITQQEFDAQKHKLLGG